MRRAFRKGCTFPRTVGYTLLEVAIAVLLFLLFFSAIWRLLDRSSAAMNHGIRAASQDSVQRKIVERLSEELRDSGDDSGGADHVLSHPGGATTASSTLSFQRRIAFAGTAADWGAPITYALAPSPGETPGNGSDDDGDGLVDEQQLTRNQNGQTLIIADGITSLTFTRNAGEYKVDFAVTIPRILDRDRPPVVRTLNATVALRNRP